MATETVTFNYAGAEQQWVVPADVTEVSIEALGAQGGTPTQASGGGGQGGRAYGTLSVTPGETLRIYVGGQGQGSDSQGAGGGGASDVRQGGSALANRVIVAGGGGGGTYNPMYFFGAQGGDGGGLSGANGELVGAAGYNGLGGSQLSGGSGASATGTAQSGSLGVGGAASASTGFGGGFNGGGAGGFFSQSGCPHGGGGGGYYGGGGSTTGAAGDMGGGGGGSSYVGGVAGGTTQTGGRAGNGQVVITYEGPNAPPSQPSLQYPTGNVMLDRTASNQFDMGPFSDPDAGDSLSAYDLQFKQTSSGTWTTVSGGATRYHTFAGGSQAAGDYHWRAQYYDSSGEPSGYSTEALYRMGTPPNEPTIVAPTNGGVIEGPNYLAQFTASGTFDGSEWRTVADNAGSPNVGTVYWSSGVIAGTGTTHTIPFATDGRYEHLQVRLRNDTFWSSWYSVRVNVNYLKQGSGSPIGYDFTTAGATGEQPPNKGSGSSGYAYSDSASGERSPVGTGSSGYAYDGTAAGEFPAKGAGLAVEYDFSGLAEGERMPEASGSTGYSYSGSAVGNAPTDGSGVAVGGYAYSGSASGHKDPEGSGVAGFSYDGVATGLIAVTGSGQASVAWVASASGRVHMEGAGSSDYTFGAASATGETPPNRGTGSTGYAFTGSASGEGKPKGSGVTAYAHSGSAVGGTVRLIFEPPTQRQAVRGDALFGRLSVPVGLSVVRTNGTLRTTPSPWLGELVGLKDGTDYFLGGHRYEVTNEVAAELQSAGYDVQSV